MGRLILRSTRVVLPDGVRPASIHVEKGTIARIGEHDEEGRGAKASAGRGGALVDAGDLAILPGLVDTHVHVNEPGRTDWEGFDTATRAAAAGGITTIADMPLNCVPATTTVEALEAKRSAARGRSHVDVAFWGGVVPGNAPDLDRLVDAGVRGFKCFLVPSGVDEFQHVGEPELREAMPILARRGAPLLVHAESPARLRGGPAGPPLRHDGHAAPPLEQDDAPVDGTGPRVGPARSYATYLATRPPDAEVDAIQMMIRLAREFGTRTHIVHVASAEALGAIARAKADGAPITAETCPHYLTFAAEQIADGATAFKCAPPIRESRHREALWHGLRSGALDLVATDHSPAPPALKCCGDFLRAWGGIASLELSLAAVWTGGGAGLARPAGTTSWQPEQPPPLRTLDVARWMSAAPASLAGLTRKGRIAPGCDADLVVFDPDAAWTVDPMRLQQRHALTPYAGRRLRGVVRTTFVRGIRVWDEGRLVCGGAGRLV